MKVPLIRPFQTGHGVLTEKEFTLLKISSEGFTGWGEASPETAPFQDIVLDYKRNLIPFALQTPFEKIDDFSSRLSVMKAGPEARAGLEMAVWDLLARKEGQPLFRFLSGRRFQPVRTARILDLKDEAASLQTVENLKKAGHEEVVLKVTPGTVDALVSLFEKSRAGIAFILDAEGTFSKENIGLLEKLKKYFTKFLVDPFPAEKWEEIASVGNTLNIPVALKDAVTDVLQLEKIVKSRFINLVCIDPWRVGGLSAAKRYLEMAAGNSKPGCVVSQFHLGLGTAQALALGPVQTEALPVLMTRPEEIFVEDGLIDVLKIQSDGTVKLPDEAGTGAEIDENRLTHFEILEEEYW